MQMAWPPFLETYLEVPPSYEAENAVALYTRGFTNAALPNQAWCTRELTQTSTNTRSEAGGSPLKVLTLT